MTMTTDQYLANVKFLKDHEASHPHSCRTKVKFPRPEVVHKLMPGVDFVRAPLGKKAEWRFRTEAGMIRFKQNYTTLDNRV